MRHKHTQTTFRTLLCGVLFGAAAAITAVAVPAQEWLSPPEATPNTVANVALQPFVARYHALYNGKPAGSARMRLSAMPTHWRVDLGIDGERGMAGVMGLNLQQSTVFQNNDGRYRPLSQSTVRKGLFMGRKTVGTYDWSQRRAQWTGDVKAKHKAPVALQDGDMSGLLINLAIVRDAAPGKALHYRFVDGGRVRDHHYLVASAPENIEVEGLAFAAWKVARTNGGNDDTIVWVAEGVPTPVRILMREDGQDRIDLQLIEYTGTANSTASASIAP